MEDWNGLNTNVVCICPKCEEEIELLFSVAVKTPEGIKMQMVAEGDFKKLFEDLKELLMYKTDDWEYEGSSDWRKKVENKIKEIDILLR